MSEIPTISLSKWQVLYRHYEQAIWQSEKATFRTTKIIGTKEEHPDEEILKALAREITIWRNKGLDHFDKRQKRLAQKATTSDEDKQFEEAKDELDKQLKELAGESVETIVKTDEITRHTTQVDPSQIELYEINENSRVNASVYPLSFRCQKCGHYTIVNPRTSIDLTCPCCEEAWCGNCGKAEKFKNNKCVACGNNVRRNALDQFSFVFACPRCANTEELTPRIVRLRNVQGSTIPCQNQENQCKGHMHFYIFGSFQNAYWKCETCGYREKVDKHCRCHISKVEEQGLKAIPSIMRPITTSAPSLTSPLIKSYLYMGTSTVSLDGLEKEHNSSKSTDSASWNLKDEVTQIDLQAMKEKYGILNAFTVPKITTLTIVYGFRSGIQTFPLRITENERLGVLFKHVQKYHAYMVKTSGRGLVIVLDKQKVINVLKNAGLTDSDTYEDLVDQTKTTMETEQFQLLIENPNSAPLISLLHTLEHALLQTLMDQTGLEDFGSKIMLDDCCIVLFEREDLASGGITQLTRSKQGTEFKKLLLKSERYLKVCPQLCNHGCIACVFISDFYCQPYMPNEVSRWFPANSLLNRNLAREFFNIQPSD